MNPEYAVELRAREPIFHHPELGTDRASFEAQTAADYWEVGASGNVYRRDYIWEVLADRYAADEDDPWEIDDFACRPVADTTSHVPAAPGRAQEPPLDAVAACRLWLAGSLPSGNTGQL